MTQQRHSTEIEITLNDATVQRSITRMTRSFGELTDTTNKAFTGAAKSADAVTRQMKSHEAITRRMRRPDAPTRLMRRFVGEQMGGMTALDRLRGGARVGDLDDLAAGGRASQEAALARARQIAEQHRRAPSLFRRVVGAVGREGVRLGRGAAYGVGTLGTAALTGDAAGFARSVGAVGGTALQAAGLTRIAGALPIVGGIAGALISRRMQRVGQVMGLERAQTELALGGVENVRGARARFAQYGISGGEGLNALRAFQRGVGVRDRVFGARHQRDLVGGLSRAMLRGIDPNVLAQFAAGGALGGGALGGDVLASLNRAGRVMGMGREMGLAGGGISRLLGLIAVNTARLASEGLSFDEDAAASFIRGIDIEARRQGARQVQGIGAGVAFQRFGGALGGVSGGFGGQFGGIGQGALVAAAARGGGGPLDIMRRLEGFRTTPSTAIEALRGIGLEGETLQLALIGMGLSTDQAGVLLGARPAAPSAAPITGDRGVMARGMAFSRIAQAQQERLISTVERDPTSVRAILALNERFEKMALSMTQSDTVLIKGIEKTSEVIDALVEMMGELQSTVTDLRGFMDRWL